MFTTIESFKLFNIVGTGIFQFYKNMDLFLAT